MINRLAGGLALTALAVVAGVLAPSRGADRSAVVREPVPPPPPRSAAVLRSTAGDGPCLRERGLVALVRSGLTAVEVRIGDGDAGRAAGLVEAARDAGLLRLTLVLAAATSDGAADDIRRAGRGGPLEVRLDLPAGGALARRWARYASTWGPWGARVTLRATDVERGGVVGTTRLLRRLAEAGGRHLPAIAVDASRGGDALTALFVVDTALDVLEVDDALVLRQSAAAAEVSGEFSATSGRVVDEIVAVSPPCGTSRPSSPSNPT